ncbi:hypothetical protein CSC62_05485 [Pseudoxanthomonas jiangsuensis]|nr:hypothetical protein CSC62_05485 [Pseudoxanthomonas jiangsuensis]
MVAVAVGGAVVGAATDIYAANKSASAAKAAGRNATAEQARQFNQTREDMMPWLESGEWALDRQQQVLNGDYSGFLASPDYQAALQLGTEQLDAGATAGGNLWGGGADADRIQFGQQLASQNLGNYWNRLAGLSQTGQTTANQLGAYGQNYAQQYGQNQWGVANARSSAYGQQADAVNNLANLGISAYGYKNGWFGGKA